MYIYIHIYTYIHTMEGWRDDKYVTRNIETCTCEGPPSSPPIPWPVTIESVLKRICKMQKDSSCKDCPQLCHNAHCGNSDISKPILRPSCIWAQNLSGTPFLRTKSRKPICYHKMPLAVNTSQDHSTLDWICLSKKDCQAQSTMLTRHPINSVYI